MIVPGALHVLRPTTDRSFDTLLVMPADVASRGLNVTRVIGKLLAAQPPKAIHVVVAADAAATDLARRACRTAWRLASRHGFDLTLTHGLPEGLVLTERPYAR